MKQVSITINGEKYEIQDLGEQQLSSSHLRSDICYHFCDLFKQCGRFLFDAAVPCLLAMDKPDEGTGFYFRKVEQTMSINKGERIVKYEYRKERHT